MVLATADHHEDDDTDDRWDTKQYQNWSLLLQLGGQERATKGRDDLDGTEWHVEEDRLELVEAKALDDQGAEGCDATTWYTDRRQHREPEPCLDVQEGLQDMIPLPDPRGNTHLVHAQTLNCDQLLVFVEELGLHWRVGHEDVDW